MTRHPRVLSPSPDRDDATNEEIAGLLRAACREYGEELDEPAAFRRLSARLPLQVAADSAPRRRWSLFAAPALGALLLVLVWPDREPIEQPMISADIPRVTSAPVPPAPRSAPLTTAETEGASAPKPALPEPAAVIAPSMTPPSVRPPSVTSEGALAPSEPNAPSAVQGRARARRPAGSEPERQGVPRVAVPAPSERTLPSENEADCLELARRGEPRQAEACFEHRARGSGLGAEMALYEVARLRADVLRDGSGALDALREHGVRFPQGSLRHEVDLFEVELLARLGRAREALKGSEELLATASGAERAAELHLLRGNVYRQALSDPVAAEREYARAEALGGASGAQATYLRALCFETLGNAPAAIDGYRRYLSVAGRPQREQARARLQHLERGLRAADFAGQAGSPP